MSFLKTDVPACMAAGYTGEKQAVLLDGRPCMHGNEARGKKIFFTPYV